MPLIVPRLTGLAGLEKSNTLTGAKSVPRQIKWSDTVTELQLPEICPRGIGFVGVTCHGLDQIVSGWSVYSQLHTHFGPKTSQTAHKRGWRRGSESVALNVVSELKCSILRLSQALHRHYLIQQVSKTSADVFADNHVHKRIP
jgi:hypothetical protein